MSDIQSLYGVMSDIRVARSVFGVWNPIYVGLVRTWLPATPTLLFPLSVVNLLGVVLNHGLISKPAQALGLFQILAFTDHSIFCCEFVGHWMLKLVESSASLSIKLFRQKKFFAKIENF